MAKSVLADLVTGFVCLGVVMTGFVTGLLGQNLRSQVILVGALFLFAGTFRGAADPTNSWIKGLLIGLGSAVPICIMAVTGVAFTSRPHLMFFLATSFLAAIAGAHVRRLWRSAHRRTSLAIAASSAATVILVAYLFVPSILETLSTRRVRYAAPAFSFRSIDSRPITNESLHGRIAVLAFWATWCAPCREELPRLNALYGRYEKNPDVVFLAVDNEREDFALSAAKAKAFFEKTRVSLPLVISEGDSSRNLGVSSLPSLVIIDQQGNVRLFHSGYDGAENLEGIVDREIASLVRSAR